jgi:hypothetical protein
VKTAGAVVAAGAEVASGLAHAVVESGITVEADYGHRGSERRAVCVPSGRRVDADANPPG